MDPLINKIHRFFKSLENKNKLCSEVHKGFGRDKERGFPTANVDLPLEHGIYFAKWNGRNVFLFKGFRGDNRTLCHVLDYNGDLYNKRLCFTNVKKIPDIMMCHGFYSPCHFKFSK